jgi:NADPH2:quinone reductase
MKAWRIHELGEPIDVLVREDVDEPVALAGQIGVRVLASVANFPDVLMCRGEYQIRPELPFTPGVELCGEVTHVGDGESGFAVGDRVVGLAAIPNGAFAEHSLMENVGAFSAPPEFDDAQAAAFLLAYQTGWFGLHRRAQLAAGEVLLVHAAAGGVGSAAVQLGKAAGATVIGVVGSPDKVLVAREQGADFVIDRSSQDFVAAVKDITNGRGANVIYDPVGGDTFMKSTKCVAFEGRIIVVGFAGGEIQSVALSHALVKNYSIVGLHWGLYSAAAPQLQREAHTELLKMVTAGQIRPLIGERLTAEQVPAGLTSLAAGRTVGRVAFVG